MSTKCYLYKSLLIVVIVLVFSCNKTIETSATVLDTTYNPLIGGDWSEKARYEFYVDGEKYVDTVYIKRGGIGLIKGQKVQVIYNKNNPKESKLKN